MTMEWVSEWEKEIDKCRLYVFKNSDEVQVQMNVD